MLNLTKIGQRKMQCKHTYPYIKLNVFKQLSPIVTSTRLSTSLLKYTLGLNLEYFGAERLVGKEEEMY